MKTKEMVIMIILFLGAAVGLVYGFVYLFGSTLMPFHFAFLGKTQAELDPRAFDLMVVMKRVIGAHFLVVSLGSIILALRFARGDVFARWAVLVMVLISQAVLLYAAYAIHNESPSRYLNVLEIVLVIIVFFLSRKPAAKGV
jgi:hypothetical protein